MLFNSFIFAAFLPLVFALYWGVFRGVRARNLLLITAGFVFYGWWDWRFLLLLLATSLTDYGVALAMGGEAVSRAREKKHFARLLQTRSEASICHFARSIDCRHVDTWVVRAVYEELQACLAHHRARFPLRVTDRLGADLQIDGDELDLDGRLAR